MSIERRRDPFTHLTGGAISGMTACIILQPLDLIKTRLQQSVSKTQPYRRSILLATVKDIIQKNGVTGLWRGTVPTVVRNVPGTAMYFTTLSEVRNLMKSMRPFWPSTIAARDCEKWENLLSGVIARGAVGYIMMPVTVVKVRYESNIYNYQRMSEAFRSIIKYDGVRGLFAGYGATFIRDAPFAGIYLFFYEQCKTLINAWKDQQSVAVANVAVNLSSGVVAGTAATCITQPFDLMKTRMQLNPHVYRNTLYTAKRVLMENGIKGFFDGISLRLARKPLSSAISWAIYEEVVRFLAHRQPVSQTAV